MGNAESMLEKVENKLLLVKFNTTNENKIIRDMKINTMPKRLKEIIGDIKIRNEILKELQHNAIDAGADNIKIDIQYKNDQRVKITIKYAGIDLESFADTEKIINAILKVDESEKSNNEKMLGGKGRGLKVIFCAGKINIKAIKDNKETQIEIDEPNAQINKIDKGIKENLEIKVIKENYSIFEENSVTFELDDVDTDNIQSFEQESLVKYIRYFTVMGRVTDKYNEKSHIEVEVKGLVKVKDEYNMDCYETVREFERINMEETIETIKEWGIVNNCSFNYLKCYNGELISNVNLREFLSEEDLKTLSDFFNNGKKCYLFRTVDSNFRNKIMISSKGVQGNFFGVYIGAEDVMINDRFTELTKQGASNSGGNLFSQYFGYIYSDTLTSAGNRNTVAGDTLYFDFKEELNVRIMPLINKILSYGKLKKGCNKKQILKDTLPSTIQGLFGELKYIYQEPSRINGWVSYQREANEHKPHDFEYDNETFAEVKTKVYGNGVYDYLIEINSINQLDDTIEGKLYVYFLRRYSNSSNTGENIFDLIKSLIEKINVDMIDNLFDGIGNYLNIDDFKSYYEDVMANMSDYNFTKLPRFKIIKWNVYNIDENFPKIKRDELKDGIILDGGYKVDLNFANPENIILENGQLQLII